VSTHSPTPIELTNTALLVMDYRTDSFRARFRTGTHLLASAKQTSNWLRDHGGTSVVPRRLR